MKKILALFSQSVLLLCLFSGCGGNGTLKVGLIAELSGELLYVGESCREAAELFVEEVNRSGGVQVDGTAYEIELVIADCSLDTAMAEKAVMDLAKDEEVIAIIGPNASSNAVAAAGIAEEEKILLISPWSTNPNTTLTDEGKPKTYVFRACFTDIFEGEVMAQFAANEMGIDSAAVLYDMTAEVLISQAERFAMSFKEQEGIISAFESYERGDADVEEQLERIKNTNPDAVFLSTYFLDVANQAQIARDIGITVPFLGSDAWITDSLIEEAGTLLEGSYVCNHYSPESERPETRDFVESYMSKHGRPPDDVAALTYDSMGLLRKALENAEKGERGSVRDAMAQLRRYEGVTGEMFYEENSRDPEKPAVILQIREGKFVYIMDMVIEKERL